ncbi:MAG: type and secretion system protein [Edaphobacter sp.]|nr:type and secretion system protein [Edaphobacter sp.]
MGMMSGTFWKPMTSNTIFVAQNTRTRRTDLDPMAMQTFYLSNVSQQVDATEVLAALRNIFDQTTKVFLVPSQNAIVLRATPDQLALAQELLNNLDRTMPEVVVDVAVLEVNRDKERKLGIVLPQKVTLTPETSSTNSSTSTTTSTTKSATSSTSATALSNLALNWHS